MGDSWGLLEAVRFLLALSVVLIAPGYLLGRWLRLEAPLVVRVAAWIGLSFGCLTLCYLWAATVQLHLAPPFIQAMALLASGAALTAALRGMRRHPSSGHPSAGCPQGATLRRDWDGLIGAFLLVLILVLTIGVRFVQVQTLALPIWVDSVHNALLIRVAFEQGQVPIDYTPYLPVEHSPFHWGYHALLSATLAIAGLPMPDALPQAMLWGGQILNGLIALTCAALAQRLWKQPMAAPVAALIVGLVSIMPAYYTSWGRYTLMAGALLLPVALLFMHDLVQQPQRSIIPAAITLAGLLMTHQVLWVFVLAGGAALWLCIGWGRGNGHLIAVRLALAIAASLILALPWVLNLVRYAFGGEQAPGTRIAGSAEYNAMPWALFWAVNNRWLLALAGIGALLSLLRFRRPVAALLIWCCLALLLTNPVVVGVPYSAQLHNEYVALLLFLPCALLIAGGVAVLSAHMNGQAIHTTRNAMWYQLLRAGRLIIPISILGLGLWGAWQSRSVVRPDTILATADDRRAIAWVSANTPPDARFVVATAGWLGNVDRGADGGWWLLPLTGRAVSTPPVLYTYADPAFVQAVQSDTGWLRNNPDATPEELAQFMRERGYTHVYLSRRGWGAAAERLRSSALFEALYASGDVAIVRLRKSSE